MSSSIRPYATVSESSGDIHVYFNGAVDHSVATDELALSLGADMNDTVAAWILSAQHTLDVAVYNFNDQTLAGCVQCCRCQWSKFVGFTKTKTPTSALGI